MTNNCLIHPIILNVKNIIIHFPNVKLSYKNKIIGVMYPQYREEQHVNGKNDNKVHYIEMWKNKMVY